MKPTISLLAWLAMTVHLPANEGQPLDIKSSKETQLGERTVTFVKIAPPILERAAPVPPAARVPLTLAQEQREAKRQDRIEIIATVCGTHPVFSKLQVRRNGKEYAYVSNVDFRDLTQVSSFEGADVVYDWFPWVYEGETDETTFPVELQSDRPSFLPVGKPNAFAQDVLTLIHDYYAANKAHLIADRARREAAAAAEEEENKKNPPEKKPVTFIYWELPAQK